MADALFEVPRLARIYDTIDGLRDDLDHYETIVEELGANTVRDAPDRPGKEHVFIARTTG